MKKVFKFVKGKKEERKESGGITPSQSGELISPAQTPEDEAFLGPENSTGYAVDFGGKDKTLTKLHKAAWQGNLEKLKSALKKVDVDSVDKRNRTALHFAVAQGHPNIVWFLLGNNANTSIADDDGHTPLLKAIECGHKDCTNLLLDRGADVNVSDYAGNTGLHLAVDRVSLDTAAALVRKDADTDISNNAGDYPLHIATRLENKDLVALLLDAGASVDVQDRENRTPLMLAAKTGNTLLTQTFVEHGAQLSLADSNGWTAHDYAMLGGHESVSASLKTSAKNVEETTGQKKEDSDLDANDEVGSWGDSQTETSEKEPITQKLKKMFEKCSEDEGGKEKNEDLSESPDADNIPPYCQPPRSWEIIQAGMIDENKSRMDSKRRSITTLGTLHSRRESFTSSPQFTLSLNRRRSIKGNNDFAKQRFSFNEEESLRYWLSEEKTAGKSSERVEVGNMVTLQEMTGKGGAAADSDWDSASEEKSQSSEKAARTSHDAEGEGEQNASSGRSESGTFGRAGTMREMEEVWVSCPRSSPSAVAGMEQNNSWDSEDAGSEKEGNFPPPPTALELGIDMARSIRYMKGMSVDRPPGCAADKNLWKNVHERHSLDFLEERDFAEISKGTGKPTTAQSGEKILRSIKPTDRFADVNKRINQELECYDQALRELAETSGKCEKFPSQNYHSLPSIKTAGGRECSRANSQELTADASSRHSEGPNSLPLLVEKCNLENNERLGPEFPEEKAEEKLEKKKKRHMLLAMRDVKHAVHVTNSFKSSLDDQILSPLMKEDFGSGDEESTKGIARGEVGDSPLEENPFFGIGRQETVLERNGTRRKSSSSGTGEESTLWLQDDSRKKEPQCPGSDDDVSEIAADERWKHQRTSSFSPLGLIHKEMEEESWGTKTSARVGPSDEAICTENEERREEIFREQSPDVSLSSGPIEPIGAEKDSGSEPESSHNEVSPTHHYAVKSQHEWLKCHLKAATTEKSKLEELTAQLTEKAERLQYELADAREAAKSRDEVIRLLQGQLARMEAAYTKSLEESVQSRLQLTSREQEILHLKEICYRYEEEKETAEGGARGDFLDGLKSKVKMLEEEKEKMREEIRHLEEEKCLLEKRLKRGKKEEAEMVDECQRWKERYEKLEEMAKTYESRQAVSESLEAGRAEQENIRQKIFQLEKKCVELNEENVQLKAKIQCLSVELEFERKKASASEEKQESISEMKRKTVDMQMQLKKLESDMEENLVKRLKEKEGEVEGLLKQFNRERNSLVAAYECRLKEERSGQIRPDAENPDGGTRRLKQVVESLKDQMLLEQMRMSASMESVHEALKVEFSRLKEEWDSVSKTIAEARKDPREMKPLVIESVMPCESKGKSSRMEEETEGLLRGPPNACDVKCELLDLKTQVLSLRELLECERWPSTVADRQRESNGKKRGVGIENELAWSSLYGMKRIPRRERTGRSAPTKDGDVAGSSEENVSETKKRRSSEEITKNYESELNEKCQKLEFLELKKEILSLQSRMLDEKNLRHALENQMIKMNLDLSNKDNLEKEVNSLKRKVDREYLRSSEMELIQYERDLEAKREKYLSGWEGVAKGANDDYKAKCQVLAKERENSERIRDSLGRKSKSFECAPLEGSSQRKFHSCPSRPLPERFLQPRPTALDPDIKHKLEMKLDNSIRKYVQGTSSSSSVPTVQLGFIERKQFQ